MYVFSVVTADVLPVISFHLYKNYIWIQVRVEQTYINVLYFLCDLFLFSVCILVDVRLCMSVSMRVCNNNNKEKTKKIKEKKTLSWEKCKYFVLLVIC